MNKSVYSYLFAFCLGYIASNFNSDFNLFPIAPVHADISDVADTEGVVEPDLAALLEDLDFRLAVKEIVEDCTVEDNKIHC
jgi:hypothetical protein